MILCVGLSPAWQQITVVDRLVPGAVNRLSEVHWCASGKVLNVALAVHALHRPAHAISVLGGSPAESIRQEFARKGCAASWVETAAATRVCTTILDQAAGQTTELVENAAALSESELQRFEQSFLERLPQAKAVVFSGSLPQAVPADFPARLLAHVSPQVPTILDIRGPELCAALPLKPWLVKPNREELALTLDRPLETSADIDAGIAEMLERGAQAVCVTDGERPVRVGFDAERIALQPPRKPVVNPIGCGDCLTAGAAAGLVEGADWEAAVRFGMAAAVDNLSHLLPAQITPQSVQEILASIELTD